MSAQDYIRGIGVKTFALSILISFTVCAACLAQTAKTNLQAYTRDAVSLNGEWKTIVDPYENGYYNYRYKPHDTRHPPSRDAYFTDSKMQKSTDRIEYDFDKADSLQVPGDWNTQNEKLYYYEGTVWYRKVFDIPKSKTSDRLYLYFGAVNYRADIYLNAKKIGVHEGGFTPFHFDVTKNLKREGNSLVVKVDNKRRADYVPTLNTDWWNYGGITRDVKIVSLPHTFVRDYSFKLASLEQKQVTAEVLLDGASVGESVRVAIPELKLEASAKVDEKGIARFDWQLPGLSLWTPENPKRYKVEISAAGDVATDTIGFRTITTQGRSLLLNGKPIFLRGMSVHEEYAAEGGGRVRGVEDARKLLGWAKSLNCNFLRLAHYPHNEHMVREAEKMGILLWSEIPVYWTISWDNEATYQNAEDQLSAMIGRDKNRAAVIIWSLANETPISESRNRFLTRLATKARALDDTRLLSAAMERHYRDDNAFVAVVEDALADIVDIVSFNQYIGWYDGLPEKANRITWDIPYEKPIFVSEFGGGAKFGYHGDKNTLWTEEYQQEIYINTLKMLDNIDGFVGTSPWILVDFRSPRRPLKEIQDDFNRKGLLSEKGERKKAFFIVREYYRKKKELAESSK